MRRNFWDSLSVQILDKELECGGSGLLEGDALVGYEVGIEHFVELGSGSSDEVLMD